MKSNVIFHRLPAITLVMTAILIFCPLSGRASEDFESAISGATLSILEKLTYAEKLQGKKLAVLGFADASTNAGCKDLSLLLANRITSELDRYRPISKSKYQIMSRHNLDAIETEYLISRKEGTGDFDVFTDLLGKSDILITGTWQDAEDSFDLTIRALEIRSGEGEDGARILASISKTISKSRLAKNVLMCLDDNEPTTFQINYVYRPGGVGELRPIRENEVLNSGDHYKIIVTPDKDCYVYLFQVDSSGQIFQLFPMKNFGGVQVNNFNPVKGGETYTLPSPKKAFKLDWQVGLERFYFIVSKEENRAIEELYNDLLSARKRDADLQIATAQEKLKTLFKRRGPAEIVDDQPVQISWEGNLFSTMGKRLADICDDCVYVLEFEHR